MPACWLHERKILHRGNGDCLSSPCPEITQFSLSLYVSEAFQFIFPSLKTRVSVYEQISLCKVYLKGCLGPHSLPFYLNDQNHHCLSQPDTVGVSFPRLVLEPEVGLGFLTLLGVEEEPLEQRYSSQFSATRPRCGASLLHVSTFPTSLEIASSL